jgi:serine/threonine protein kinase
MHGRRIFCELIFALDYLSRLKLTPNIRLSSNSIHIDGHSNVRLHYSFGCFLAADSPSLYSAPEVLNGSSETTESILWSIGVILYQSVTGTFPFSNFEAICRVPPNLPATLSPQLNDLLYKLFEKNPIDRISISRIKDHQWFSLAEYESLTELSTLSADNTIKHEVHKPALDRLTELGYDTKQLAAAILSGTESPLLGVYELVRRDAVADRIEAAIQKTGQGGEAAARAVSNSPVARSIRRAPPKQAGAAARVRASSHGDGKPVVMGRLPLLMRPRTNSFVEKTQELGLG